MSKILLSNVSEVGYDIIKLSYFCSAGNPLGPVVANSAGSLNVGESSAHYSCWQRGDGSGGGADDGERQKDVTLY